MDPDSRFAERLAALRDAFVRALPSRVEAMRVALARGDGAALLSEAHRLAGTGVSYGVPALTAWGRAAEQACKRGATAAELMRALDELQSIVDGLCPPRSAIG